MSVYVKNVGTMLNGNTVNQYGGVGTVKVEYQGQQFNFGPNETKVFADNGIAAAVAAQSSNLRVMTDADGIGIRSNASTAFSAF